MSTPTANIIYFPDGKIKMKTEKNQGYHKFQKYHQNGNLQFLRVMENDNIMFIGEYDQNGTNNGKWKEYDQNGGVHEYGYLYKQQHNL